MEGDVDQITFIPTSDERIDWSPLDEPVEDEFMDDPLAEDLIPEITLKVDPAYKSEDGGNEDYLNNEDGSDDDCIIVERDVLKVQKNSNRSEKTILHNENKGFPEVLNGIHKESRIYHDGNGYYFSTNRKAFTNKKNESIRYLRCVKAGCRARGHISDKKGSPFVLTYDTHNHQPLSAYEQAAKRAKSYVQSGPVPPVNTTKISSSYMRMNDGTLYMVNIDAIKSPASDPITNNRVNDDSEKNQPSLSPPISERKSLQPSSAPLRCYQRKPAQVPLENSSNVEKMDQLPKKKMGKVESLIAFTRSLKPILPRPENMNELPKKKMVKVDIAHTRPLKPILPRPESGDPVQNSFSESPSLQILPPTPQVCIANDIQRQNPQNNNVTSLSDKIASQSRSIDCSELPSGKSVVKKKVYVAAGKSEVICDCKNIPVFYHDGKGFVYTLNLFRNHVRYLVCMRKDCKAKARMDAVPGATIIVVSGESHNHIPMNSEEQALLRENTAKLSYYDATKIKIFDVDKKNAAKASENINGNITVNIDSPTTLNDLSTVKRIASIQKFKMDNNPIKNVVEQSEDNVILIKQEPENQDVFLDEASDTSHTVTDDDVNNESECAVEDNNSGQNENYISTNEVYVEGPKIKQEIVNESERNDIHSSSDPGDNNKEANSLNEEVYIKEEERQQVDEYLSMTVDDESEEDDDSLENSDGYNSTSCNADLENNGNSNNDNTAIASGAVVIKKEIQDAVANNSINCVPIPIPLPSSITGINDINYSSASLENSVTTNQSIGLISSSQQFNEKQPTISTSVSGDNNIVFSTNNQNYSLQNQKNLQSLVGIKVPIPKDKNDSRNIIESLNLPVQPQNINYLGLSQGITSTSQAASQFQTNVQNAPVLQFSSDNNAINNQNVQYIQLGQNGPFIQIPCQNSTATNPYGYIVPPQFFPMTPQPLQNSPFIQMVQPGQIDKVAANVPQTIRALPQNSQICPVHPSGQNKVSVPQTISTVTGPDGTIYHLVGPTPVTNQENNNSRQILPSQETDVQEVNQVSAAKPSVCTSVQQNNESTLALSDNTTFSLSQSGQPVHQIGQVSQLLQNKSNNRHSPSSVQVSGQILQLPQKDQTGINISSVIPSVLQNGQVDPVVQSQVKDTSSVSSEKSGHILLSNQGNGSTSQTVPNIQLSSQVYQSIGSDSGRVPASELPSSPPQIIQQNGYTYQLVRNEKEKVPQCIQQGGQIYQLMPSGAGKIFNSQPVSLPQQNSQVLPLVQNEQGKVSIAQTVPPLQQSGQVLQLVQNDQGRVNIPQTVPSVQQSGQVLQLVQSDQGGVNIPQTVPSVQQSGQMYQFLQNDAGKGTCQLVQCVQQNGQIYQLVQSNQGKLPISQTGSAVEQNGQVFQVLQNDAEKTTTTLPFQQIQPNGSIIQVVQGEQGKSLSQNVIQTVQQNGQIYQIIQNNQVKDSSQVASNFQNPVFQLMQSDKTQNLTNLPNRQIAKYVSDNSKINVSKDGKPVIKKIVRGSYNKAEKPFSQSQVGKLAQILPKQVTTISASVSVAPQSITSSTNLISTSPIFRAVPCDCKSINTSQADVTTTNTPPMQFVQSGQDKCIPQTVSSSQSNTSVQSTHNGEEKDKIQTIVGPNGVVYQIVQSTDTQVKGNGSVYKLIPSDSKDYQSVQGSQINNTTSQQIFSALSNYVNGVNSQVISAVPGSTNNVAGPQVISGIQSGMSNLNPQIISAPANNQVFQVVSDGLNNISTSQSGCVVSNNNTSVSASSFNTAVSSHQAVVSTTSSVSNNANLAVASNDTSSIQVNESDVPSVSTSSTSGVMFSQVQNNLSPIVSASGVQLSQSVSSINKNNNLPSLTSATIRNNSETKSVGKPIKTASSTPSGVKGFVPIAPAPFPGEQFRNLNLVYQESKIEEASTANVTEKSPGSCDVTPSEQLMGLNDEVIYHDGKGYYYRFDKMKYKTKNSPNDQKMLRCIKDRCPAVASLTVGEPFSPIRHGLWSHTHNSLSTDEQIERKVRLITFNRMIARARNEKHSSSNDVLRQIFVEEMERFKDVMRMCGVEPRSMWFDRDIYAGSENNFIDEVLANEVQKEESEGTIAMSVKKRPRVATIHIKPIVDDDAIDNNADDLDDGDDMFDQNYSTNPDSIPKIKRRRGRPRKNKLRAPVDKHFDSLLIVDVRNVKAEALDYDMSEDVDSDEMAEETKLQIVTKQEMEDS